MAGQQEPLFGHWVQFGGSARDKWMIGTNGDGNRCCQRDLMMMMYIDRFTGCLKIDATH